MATYTNTITVPTGTDFSNGQILFLYEFTNTEASPSYATIAEIVDYIKLYYEAGLGGTLTFTSSTSGGNTIYVLTYVDPDITTMKGDILSIILTNDGDSIIRSSNWIEEITPTETIVCPTCQEITKSACSDEYTFVAGLTPSTVYYVVIETNRNKRYVQAVTTDGSGDFAIDASATGFPIGFFIPEQLKYTIKVYSDSTLMLQQDITVGSTIYKCITLGFVNTVTTTASIDFGVDFLIDDELNFIVDDLGNTFSV
jgi:hypothetical protein